MHPDNPYGHIACVSLLLRETDHKGKPFEQPRPPFALANVLGRIGVGVSGGAGVPFESLLLPLPKKNETQ